jgi:hypothetical protein
VPTNKVFGRFHWAQHAAEPKNHKNAEESPLFKNFTIDHRNTFERNANRFLKTYFIMEENPKSEILTRIYNFRHTTSTALTEKKLMTNWVRKIVTLNDFSRPNHLLPDMRYVRALRDTYLHPNPEKQNIILQKFATDINRKYGPRARQDSDLTPQPNESQKSDPFPMTKFVLQYFEVLEVYP